jgi:hypothetical protein
VNKASAHLAVMALACSIPAARPAFAQVKLLAVGQLTDASGGYTDLSGLTDTLENGVPANLLGGLGSGLAWASGNTFLALPDRGPNAVSYDAAIDDTVSFIARFHTVTMDLQPNGGSGLPFLLTPTLGGTTLLYSIPGLVYGSGSGLGVGPGAPPQNSFFRHYFTGRSDDFDATKDSGSDRDARLDPEGIRVSNNGKRLYVSDEYGPYVYEFDVASGARRRTFTLPDHLFVTNLSPVGAAEISGNTSGRTANKGMEGLAITPDGRTLVGFMQAALIQDANQGGPAKNLLRIETIDIPSGLWRHEFAYLLTTGSGVSEVVALNDHEFLVDERDGKGRGDGSVAKVKQIFKIDLSGAVDVANMDGLTAAANAVSKSLFADLVKIMGTAGITADQVPAKLEGLALGDDIDNGGVTTHTMWVANDNDFLQDFGGPGANPNNLYVFGFTDADLGGSAYVPQDFKDGN